MNKPTHRIYMVGAHSTGKTTLARWVRDTYGLPMISEVARGVLAEMEARLDALRSDIDLVNRYQREVFERQISNELSQTGSFVSDRAFCNLAYAAHHSQVLPELARDERLARYMEFVREGLVFFVRPHRALVVHDGVRAGVEWEDVVRIDGMVKLLLEWFDVPYIPMASLSMQERVRQLERVLSLAGLSPCETRRDEGPGVAAADSGPDFLRRPVRPAARALRAFEVDGQRPGNGHAVEGGRDA